MRKQQSGFTAIEIAIAIVVIGVLGIVGWTVMGRKSTTSKNNDTHDTIIAKEFGACFGTCVYPFAAEATATNSFTIDLGTYANQANLDASQKYVVNDGGAVEGLGDSASYTAKDAAISNSRDFVLVVRQGLKIYTFGISQPTNALTYNDASAQRVLIQIAQAATL
ncbi:MAG: prepilin-type N-terminal cleavage/methylation domain-containing protein [Candidatus Saccharibacteria bacterium]|nr:prepilin-type N-terminal cleavage/methylation domain-containing protein [Candidatus Saccharibacteria bacterium]